MNSWNTPTPDRIEEWKREGQVRKLIQALARPESPHHLLILRALEELGEEAVPALLQVLELENRNIDLLGYAVDLLALLREPRAVPLLKSLLLAGEARFAAETHADRLWISAADALGQIGSDEALAFLETLALDPAVGLNRRRRALEGLSLGRDETIAERLSSLLTRLGEPALKDAALSGLVGQGERNVGLISRLFRTSADPLWRARIAEMVGDLQARAFLPQLVNWLDDPDAEVVRRVIRALGELGDTRAYAPIKLKLDRWPIESKLEAARTLVTLGWQSDPADSPALKCLWAIGAGQLDRALTYGGDAPAWLALHLSRHPESLVNYTAQATDEAIWRRTVDALADRPEEGIEAAFAMLFAARRFNPEIQARVDHLRDERSKSAPARV